MTEATLQVLIGSAAAIIAAFNFPKMLDSWRSFRETRHKSLVNRLNTANAKIERMEKKLEQEEEQLKELRMKLSIIIPIVKAQNPDNKDLLELMKMVERDTNINITPNV